MPIFEYKCKKCREVFDEFRYSADSDIAKDIEVKCPACGEPGPERIYTVFGGTESTVSENSCASRNEYGPVRG